MHFDASVRGPRAALSVIENASALALPSPHLRTKKRLQQRSCRSLVRSASHLYLTKSEGHSCHLEGCDFAECGSRNSGSGFQPTERGCYKMNELRYCSAVADPAKIMRGIGCCLLSVRAPDRRFLFRCRSRHRKLYVLRGLRELTVVRVKSLDLGGIVSG